MNTEVKKCSDVPKDECTGCSSCMNTCPVDAIQMLEDEQGFIYPKIDESKCINCGLCYKRCPKICIKKEDNTNNEQPECFAFVSKKKKIVDTSSSGGAFSALADYVLKKRGAVCGAHFNYEKFEVEHILITTKNKRDLKKLKTSKYVQSKIQFCYKEIKQLLDQKKLVLFTGCGCQVAGLKAYINKNYDNLILVDIVCHGVPSMKVFTKYIEGLGFNKDDIKKVNFREKRYDGWTPSMYVESKETTFYKPKWESTYYNVFLKGMGCRLCCGHCQYNQLPRQGDFTIADFWGIEKHDYKFKGTKGASLILVNNNKHIRVVNELKKRSFLFEKEDLEIEREENGNIFQSSHTNPNRERFFNLLNRHSFDEASRMAFTRHFDIGVVGWWYGHNYGSFLTYFALNRWLLSQHYDVLMLSWPYSSRPIPPKAPHYINKLCDKFYFQSIDRTFKEYNDVNNYVDVFMIGSDQMWNYWDQQGMGYYYFLDFVDDKHPRLSYSTSFGHTLYKAPPNMVAKQKELLHKFSSISVREDDGVKICKEYFDIDAVKTMDPVFLVDKKEFDLLIEETPVNKPYLFCYILTPTKEKGELLKQISKKLNLELVIALDGQTSLEENRAKLGIDNVQMNLRVGQWLSFIKNADFIITDSFHGVCFSIIYHKQFACLVNRLRGASRFESLFAMLGLENCAFNELDELANNDFAAKINYDSASAKLVQAVEFSSEWFKNSLDKAFKEREKLKKE